MKLISWELGFIVHYRTVKAIKKVKFVSDRMSYIVLRSCWYNIIVLNMHAPSEEKSDDSKDSFHEKLEKVFIHILKIPYENSVRRF